MSSHSDLPSPTTANQSEFPEYSGEGLENGRDSETQRHEEEVAALAEKIEASFDKMIAILEGVVELDHTVRSRQLDSAQFRWVGTWRDPRLVEVLETALPLELDRSFVLVV